MLRTLFFASLCTFAAQAAHAVNFAFVPDAFKLQWQMVPDAKIFLRNLGQFNPGFQGCCYNYYIDPTTPIGKSQWTVLFARMTASQGITIGVDAAAQVGPVTYLGNW